MGLWITQNRFKILFTIFIMGSRAERKGREGGFSAGVNRAHIQKKKKKHAAIKPARTNVNSHINVCMHYRSHSLSHTHTHTRARAHTQRRDSSHHCAFKLHFSCRYICFLTEERLLHLLICAPCVPLSVSSFQADVMKLCGSQLNRVGGLWGEAETLQRLSVLGVKLRNKKVPNVKKQKVETSR